MNVPFICCGNDNEIYDINDKTINFHENHDSLFHNNKS